MKFGACEYLVKPFEADLLLDLVAKAVTSSRLMSNRWRSQSTPNALIGNSRVMQNIYKEIGRLAAALLPSDPRHRTGKNSSPSDIPTQ
jgi:DNA-binding NtrC family response regulator